MKQFRITILLIVLMSMFGVKAFAHDIEVANKDGVTIYYKWINDNTELAVSYRGNKYSSYSNEYSGEVIIPESVEYDGKTYSVTSIVYEAFRGCSGLTSVTIPNSVTSISGYAFEDCSGLTSLTIPNSVTSIGGGAFDGTVWYDSQPDGLVYAGKVAYTYKGVMPANTEITLEDGTLGIAESAFEDCSGLTSVTIPSSVTSIDDRAFRSCTGLTSLTIPNSVTSIGNSAFGWCSGLTSVTIPNSVTSLGSYVFHGCSGLTSVTIPNSVTNIGIGAFDGCEALTAVHISDMGAWCNISFEGPAHDGSNPLTFAHHLYLNGEEVRNLVIPSNVNAISIELFRDCNELTSVKIEEGPTIIGRSAFSGCKNIKTVEIPNSVTEIGTSAFYNCTAITTINMGSGVTNIGQSAFNGCSGLVTITIPSGVKEINNATFSSCTSLLSVTIPEGVETIGEEAFYNCHSWADVVIPEGVTTIGSRAFSGCYGISSLSLPKSLKSIGYRAFYNCNQMEEVKLADIVAWCSISLDYSNPLSLAQHVYVNDKEVTDLVIPEGVTSISNGAFKNCGWITSLTLPNGFTKIDENSFSGCYGMTSVSLPSSLTTIDKYAFADCGALTSITIPSSVTTIGEYALRCTGLSSVVIPNGVTTINEYTFSDCYALISLSIPESVTTIKGNAFNGCSKLENLIIPSKVEYIYQQAFADCGNLKSVKSLAETPPFLYDNSFSNYDIPLTVPEGTRDAYLAKSPWNKFKEILTGSDTKYTLTYKVDGEVYSMYKLVEGAVITPEEAPVKAGYEFSGWSTIPATMPAEDVTITGSFTLLTDYDEITIKTTGKTTWCSKYDLDFTNVEGVKAYTAAGYDDDGKTIWLMRVSRVPAGTGIMVKSNPGTYQIPHAKVKAAYANWFKGNLGDPIKIGETDGDMTNYYLSNGQFVSVNKSATIGKNKAYLQLPTFVFAGTRSVGMSFDDEDGTTGIDSIEDGEVGTGTDHVFYNLQGQRVDNPGKGLYIRNGKKVIIK